MPITRHSAQKKHSLEEFYSEWALSSDEISSQIGKSMLKTIDIINKTFKETQIYGLTSHAHLLIFSEDDLSDFYLRLISDGSEFYIEYKMNEKKQPWKNAIVKGVTKSIEEFNEYIIIAMFESQGWQKSEELQNLYRQIKR
ncbi:hypothetical protein ACQ9BO_17120 [Flavobacterium sp. P21]|uniref:hypothetical protein n=1 Tax=Flavobacterium sp. P21 TaxID=3423948 RepID=UPI003D668472